MRGSKFIGRLGGRFKLWWSSNEDKLGGVEILVKEDSCINVVEIIGYQRVLVNTFGKKVVRIVCPYAPQCGISMSEKEKFYKKNRKRV